MKAPIEWNHASGSGIPLAVKTILDSWQNQTKIYIKYLEDGTNGEKGQCIVTDCSLATGVTNMNEFTANFQGCGALTAVP
jgi:hypothetical protein